MQNKPINTKTALAFLATLSFCYVIWVYAPKIFGDNTTERPVSCDAGAYFVLDDLMLNIPSEYMQNVYVATKKKPAQGGGTYTCTDVAETAPLSIEHLRFFPEVFLNKNILIDDMPYKTITPFQIGTAPQKDATPTAGFSCNDYAQCTAVVLKDEVLFMIELSEAYFSSGLQKDIFYASFQRFVESLIVAPRPAAAE